MLYCPGDCDSTTNLLDSNRSISSYAPTRTIFDRLIADEANKTGGFMIQNTTDNFGAVSIQSEFASRYVPKDSDISVIRTNKVDNGIEPITINCQKTGRTTVQLATNPWLIFTPANNDSTVHTISKIATNDYASGYTGIPQYNNNFNIRCLAEGDWGGNIAAIPVCFGAGDLNEFTHIVLEADLTAFTLNEENPEYPSIELKIANADDSESKTISATTLFSNGKAEIPLTGFDFLDKATKIQFSIRGSGTITLKDISKAK